MHLDREIYAIYSVWRETYMPQTVMDNRAHKYIIILSELFSFHNSVIFFYMHTPEI